MTYNILWASKTGDANSWYHIMPFRKCDLVDKLYVVRYKFPKRLIKDVEYYTFPNKHFLLELIYYVLNIIKVLFTKKIDIVVAFNPYPWGFISFIFAKIMNKPILLGLIGGELDPNRSNWINRKVLLFILKYVNVIMVTGCTTKEYLCDLGYNPDKIYVFPHLVDEEYLKINKNETLHSNIIIITSFLPVKRTNDSIEALALLIKSGYDFKLTVLGDGPELIKCKELVEELGISKNVKFLGFVDDIRPYINNSEYYLQTSSSEGLSLALVESMAVGLIPIVTNVGDEKEIITDQKTGFFIPVGIPLEIANRIILAESGLKKTILENIELKMKNYSINCSNKFLCEILENTN